MSTAPAETTRPRRFPRAAAVMRITGPLAAAWSHLPLNLKGLVVIALPLGMLLFVTVAHLVFTSYDLYLEQQVSHTFEMHNRLQEVFADVSEATSAVRGYLLTRDRVFLEPYHQAAAHLPGVLENLTALVQDNPEQAERVERLQGLVRRRLISLARLQSLSVDVSAERRDALLTSGRQVLEEVRQEFQQALVAEEALLEARTTTRERARHYERIATVASLLLGLGGGLLAVFLFTGGIVGRVEQVAHNAHRLAAGEPLLPTPASRDAVGRLEGALEQTAVILEARSRALMESEARLRSVVSAAPIVLFALDTEGRFTFYEGKGLAAIGHTPGQVVGQTVAEAFPDGSVVHDYIRRALAGERFTVRVKYRDLTFESHYAPLYQAGGRAGVIDGVIGVSTDISERVRAEDALREQRDFAHTVMHTMGQGLAVTDSDRRFSYVNPAFAQMIGAAPETLLGLSPIDIVLADAQTTVHSNLAERWSGSTTTYEVSVRRRDGTHFPALVTGVPLQQADRVVGSVAVVTDLSERYDAEARLRDYQTALEWQNQTLAQQRGDLERLAEFRQALIELVVQSLHEGDETNLYGRFLTRAVQVIPAAQAGSFLLRQDDGYHFVAALGYDLGALKEITLSARELAQTRRGDHRAPQLMRDFSADHTLEGGRGAEFVQVGRIDDIKVALSVPVFLGKDVVGEDIVAYLNLDNFDDPDAFDDNAVAMAQTLCVQLGALLARVDLEGRLRAHQRELETANSRLTHANRLKSEFLANMSHELRTPLTAVIGFSELLAEELYGPLNDKQKQYVGDIYEAGSHLLSLINDILDLSKIEAGHMALVLEPTDLSEVVESALRIVVERVRRNTLTLQADIPEAVAPLVADSRKLKQVLYNLLSNAVKFTPAGGRVTVSVHDDPHEVCVEVRDTGPGIREADQSRLFQEFSQLDTSLAKTHGGTGLGLALTKRLVELHGGRVWVESRVGEGSTFGFSVPRRESWS